MSLSRPVLAQNGPSKFCGEGLMLRAERTWRGRYLRVTRVTPLPFYPEWMVQVAYQGAGRLRFMVALAAPLPGTTYAGTRWSTLAYVEKVRPQFLSLRQQVIDIAEIIVVAPICATFPSVSVSIRENSKLRARITSYSSD